MLVSDNLVLEVNMGLDATVLLVIIGPTLALIASGMVYWDKQSWLTSLGVSLLPLMMWAAWFNSIDALVFVPIYFLVGLVGSGFAALVKPETGQETSTA